MTFEYRGPRLSTTNKLPLSRRIIAGTSLIVTATIVVLVTVFAVSNSANVSARLRNAYVSPPKQLLVDAEIRFTRLPDSRLTQVRITPNVAARIAMKPMRGVGHRRVAFESLGGYVDETRIIADWVGTKSWVPKAIPAYLVRITGTNVETLGPTAGFCHSEVVIVDAISGKLEGTTIYGCTA